MQQRVPDVRPLTLDRVEALLDDDPGALADLSRHELVSLIERAEVIAARLRARALEASLNGNGAAPTTSPERAFRVKEAAALLAMSVDFLHRSWRNLGGFKDVDGHVKFSAAVIQRHIQQQRRTR